MGLGAAVTTAMFFFTYLPQLGVLFFTSGPLAVFSTVILVLSESSTLTMVLAKTLLIDEALIDTFDGTLVAKGHTGLVENQRQVKSSSVGDSIQRLGKLATKPFQKFTPAALVVSLIIFLGFHADCAPRARSWRKLFYARARRYLLRGYRLLTFV